jgi:hypothetical protein
MPSGAIEQQNGVCALGDVARYLIEVKLHGECVGDGQCERSTFTARRTDCTEEIGIIVTLVGRLARSRSTSSPLADEAVLLTDAGLVLEPDFDRGFLRQIRQMNTQRARKVFL